MPGSVDGASEIGPILSSDGWMPSAMKVSSSASRCGVSFSFGRSTLIASRESFSAATAIRASLCERRHGRTVVGGLAEKRPDVHAPARIAIPQDGIEIRVRMRAAGVGAVVAQHADITADHGAQEVGALEGPAPAPAEEFRFVPQRLRRFGPVALGPAASLGEAVLEQAGKLAQPRLDRHGDLDRLGADRDLRLGLGVGVGDDGGAGNHNDRSQDAVPDAHCHSFYSAACACPSRWLSDRSTPSAASAITVPGGKIASTPARLSAS